MKSEILERELETYFRQQCNKLGLLTLKLNVAQNRGWPDRMVIHNSHTYFVELKTIHGKVTPLQLSVSGRLATRGYHVPVLRTKEQIKEHLEAIKNA